MHNQNSAMAGNPKHTSKQTKSKQAESKNKKKQVRGSVFKKIKPSQALQSQFLL
jgi:hypothetical protein